MCHLRTMRIEVEEANRKRTLENVRLATPTAPKPRNKSIALRLISA